MIRLSEVQKNQVIAMASRLRITAQDAFIRSVAKFLEHKPTPISNSDIWQAIQLAMDNISVDDVLFRYEEF